MDSGAGLFLFPSVENERNDMKDSDIQRDAVISECGLYRYELTRRWSIGRNVNFVMLNPSTADALKDDNTIRRCIGFARDNGFASLTVTNLFALRTSSPKVLKQKLERYALTDGGSAAIEHLVRAAFKSDMIICAWGSTEWAQERAEFVRRNLLAWSEHKRLHALRITPKGRPEHPLYLPSILKPELWSVQ